jgi:hypothetical protein
MMTPSGHLNPSRLRSIAACKHTTAESLGVTKEIKERKERKEGRKEGKCKGQEDKGKRRYLGLGQATVGGRKEKKGDERRQRERAGVL